MKVLDDWRRGRSQRLLCAATAASALPLGLEIYVNHYGGSFGNKWMWTPVLLSPAPAWVFSCSTGRPRRFSWVTWARRFSGLFSPG